MDQPISVAKLTRPEPSRVLMRSRLSQRLDQRWPVTWVSAPAGSGKTTLISSYIQERQTNCIWYQADAGDSDPATFFHYLGLAAQHAAPRYKRPLPSLTPEYLLGIETFARRFFEQLYARLKSPAVLVIDNCQAIAEESPVHALLRVAAETLPAAMRLIVMSRAEPPAALARLRLNGVLHILSGEDLCLTREEAISLAALRQPEEGRRLAPAEIERLHAQVQGWTAGVVLLLEQALPSPNPKLRLPPGEGGGKGVKSITDPLTPPLSQRETELSAELTASTQELLFDYFAGEVFDQASEATQDILLKTALLPQMTVSMAEQLTGDPTAGQVLGKLLRRNFFIVQRVEGEPAYEYHPLFREFLLSRIRRLFPAPELAALQKQAAVLLEKNGQMEEAANLYQETKDWEGLSRLALSQGQTLLMQGRNQTLLQWLSALPAEVTEDQPWLLYWRGMATLAFDPVQARGHLERTFALFEVQDDPTGLYLTWAGIMDTYQFDWRDMTPLDRWVEIFERLQERHPAFPSPEIELRVYSVLMMIIYRQPQHPKLPVWAEHALCLLQSCNDSSQGIPLCAYLLHYHLWRGDMFKAGWVREALQRLTTAKSIMPLTRIMEYALGAVYFWSKGDSRGCLDQVAKGLTHASTSGIHVWDSLLHAQAAYGHLIAGDIENAAASLRSMGLTMRSHTHLDGGHYHFVSALFEQQRGDFSRGLEHARQALAMATEAGTPFAQALSHMAMALSLLKRGEDAEGEEHIRSARAIGQMMGNGYIEHFCLLIEARIAFERGHEAQGLSPLRRALVLGRENGDFTVHWWGPATMAQLYVKALEHGIEVEYVQRLIRRLQLTPPDPATAPDNWPWPLKVCTMGRFSVVKDGEPLRSTGKGQRKPLELLQCLIAQGGREVPEGYITDLLWPDAEGDAAYRSLITTLQRLRQWLDYPDAVELSGGCVSLNPKRVSVDDWNFERLLSRAESAGKNGSGMSVPALTDKALALYRGPFLDKIDQPWAVSRREKLRAKFIQHLLTHGQSLEAAGLWQEAIACYLRGIETDECVEVFYQHLIRCYQQQGRTAEALAASERRRRVAAATLGALGQRK